MSFLKDIIGNPASAVVGPVLGGLMGRSTRKAKAENEANMRNFQERTLGLAQQGMQEGEKRAQRYTGMDPNQFSGKIQDLLAARENLTRGPSAKADEIRRAGQGTERSMRQAGASDTQQRQAKLETARAAEVQEEGDYERRLMAEQNFIQGLLNYSSGLSYKTGALYANSNPIMPETRNRGIFSALGLV